MTTRKRLRSPIEWFGGKGNCVKKLLPFLSDHHTYVEVFGGGASLLFAKDPSPVEVYNDLDSGLVNFFRVLRDPEKFARFYHMATLTPYAREEYNFCRETWESVEDEVERAYRWFVVARMSFGGSFGKSWGSAVTSSCNRVSKTCSKWLSILILLPAIAERMMRVQIEQQPFETILERYDTPKTLFYCDPPYVPDTRRHGKYKHEMTDEDHRRLVEMLLTVKGKVILSGYRNEIYKPLEGAGWVRHDYKTACYAAARTRATGILGKGSALRMQPRIESVWVSPNAAERKGLFS